MRKKIFFEACNQIFVGSLCFVLEKCDFRCVIIKGIFFY
jgi:hypothetical protein